MKWDAIEMTRSVTRHRRWGPSRDRPGLLIWVRNRTRHADFQSAQMLSWDHLAWPALRQWPRFDAPTRCSCISADDILVAGGAASCPPLGGLGSYGEAAADTWEGDSRIDASASGWKESRTEKAEALVPPEHCMGRSFCAALPPVQSVAAANTHIWRFIHCSISILGARTAALPASWRTRCLNPERPSRSRRSTMRLPSCTKWWHPRRSTPGPSSASESAALYGWNTKTTRPRVRSKCAVESCT